MLKKILIGVASLIVILSSIFGYIYLKEQQLPDFELHNMIPTDASIIIESNDFIKKIADVRTNNKIWKELLLLPALKGFDNDLNEIIKISTSNPIIQYLTKNNDIIISVHKIGKSNLGFLFMLELQNARDKKLILQTITELLTADKTVSSRDYNNSKIYIAKTNNKEFNFSFNKGILVFSSSAMLIENSIRQAEAEKSILNDNGFLKVRKTAGKNVDANVYLNLTKLNEIISFTLNKKQRSLISKFSNFGNWAELDINLKNDAVLLNGFTFSDESNNYLNIFLNQNPISHEMNSILPSNTSLFISFGISNSQKYFNDYKLFLEKEGKINKYQLQLDRFKNRYAIDLEQFFNKNLDEEIGIVVSDELNNNFEDNTYIIMRTKGKSVTEKDLNEIISKIAETNKINPSQFINEIQIDKETSYKVYSLKFDGVFSTFFGNIFPEFKNQHATFIDNFLIIGNSANSISKFIHANILHKTLDNDMKFDQFSNYLSSKSNFYFYTNMFRSPKYISQFLNPNLQVGLNKNIESFKKFHAFAVQFQQNNDMIYNNLYLQYISEVKDEAVTVWESHLDTSINFKPALVTNHYTKEKEIFVQDLNNKIYLINKVGRILWKVQLNEKINSEIHQVDFYKNGKLQFLFSTKSKIHLIDRKGNYVERYPVKLRSPATAGLAIFDYDKTLDYRIFIPCKNKNVYLYNLDGNLVNGWKFDQTDNYVTSPIQHLKIKSSDYLIFADKSRVYILNRRGEERIILKNHFAKSGNNSFYLETGNNVNPHFVTTDTSGLVKKIYLNGTVETKQIGNYSSKHFFEYVDINADGFKDYLFLDKNKLIVSKQDKTELFNYKFDNNIESSPVYYYFSYDDRKIGVVSKTNNEIFLFNSDGSLYDGFPLKGNTPFTIGYLGNSGNQFNLIVGTKYNFLYNYSVN